MYIHEGKRGEIDALRGYSENTVTAPLRDRMTHLPYSLTAKLQIFFIQSEIHLYTYPSQLMVEVSGQI